MLSEKPTIHIPIARLIQCCCIKKKKIQELESPSYNAKCKEILFRIVKLATSSINKIEGIEIEKMP